jgi:hypothetical protein
MLGSTESSLIQHDTSGVALSMDNTSLHESGSHLKKLQSEPARMSYEDDVPVGREPQHQHMATRLYCTTGGILLDDEVEEEAVEEPLDNIESSKDDFGTERS